jgi:hypothetical protein
VLSHGGMIGGEARNRVKGKTEKGEKHARGLSCIETG